jgi:type III restriction enzyme
MSQVIIENPALNSLYEKRNRHFRFPDDGITDEIVEARCPSSYFVPIPTPKKKGRQLAFDTERRSPLTFTVSSCAHGGA